MLSSRPVKPPIWPAAVETVSVIDEKSLSADWSCPEAWSRFARIPLTWAWLSGPMKLCRVRSSVIGPR